MASRLAILLGLSVCREFATGEGNLRGTTGAAASDSSPTSLPDHKDLTTRTTTSIAAVSDGVFTSTSSKSQINPEVDGIETDSNWGQKVFLLRFAKDPTKCLDVRGGDNQDKTPLDIWDCATANYADGTNPNQHWILPANGEGVIRWAAHPDKCIDVRGGFTDYGTTIQLYSCGDGENLNRRFKLPIDGSSGPIVWSPAHPTECLDVHEGKTDNGTPIELYGCNYRNTWSHQHFYASPVPRHTTMQPTPPPPQPVSKNALYSEQRLYRGNQLQAKNGRASLVMQENGALVLYNEMNQVIWQTYTVKAQFLVLRANGDLRLEQFGGDYLWHTNTAGSGVMRAVLQKNCDFVLYTQYWVKIWSTGTRCFGMSLEESDKLDEEESLEAKDQEEN